ncbi:retrovirus-related pol polyprotein from transposon TNT 1-94 [Tanacetum coccineum]
MISSINDRHHGPSDAMHNPSQPLKAQESSQVLDEEQLAFLADPGVTQGPDTQIIMLINAAFQTDDLDAFDSNCDEAPLAKAMLMANLSSYDSDVILEKAQRIKPTLYDGNVLTKKHDVISVINSEETLILSEESRSKMTEKQNDPISKEKNELSAEQAFWLPISNLTSEQLVVPPTLVKTEVPHELPKVIPFMNSLRESFKDFDYGLHLELNEMKAGFNQMEAEAEQCFKSFVDEYNESLELKAEHSKKNEMVEKVVYNELSKRCSQLENHCIYLEIENQQLKSGCQFCDSNLEVALRKHTCFVRNLEGEDLLSGSRDKNLYTISLDDMLKSSPICLLSKASKTKRWLWHRRLSHLNFGTINQLAKQCLVRGLPKMKYKKDHLCSTCSLRKSKKHSHKPKAEDTIQEKLYLLHMDLCGPMRVDSINGKKYWKPKTRDRFFDRLSSCLFRT